MRLLRKAGLWLFGLLDDRRKAEFAQHILPEMVLRVPARDASLQFHASNSILFERARSALSKEPDTIAWIDGFSAGDVLWDIGANVGVFSLYAGKVRGLRTISFEPSADNFAVLCRNIQLNGLSDIITPYCVALAARTGLGVLNISSAEMGSSLHQFGCPGESSPWWNGVTTHAQGTLGFSIDDFIRRFGPPLPTHIKLDVDGLELPILEGAADLLRNPSLRSIMVELSMNDAAEFADSKALLAAADFECVRLGQSFQVGEVYGINHFFERRS